MTTVSAGCRSDPADLERIEELHATDMRASREQDFHTLRRLMSDDAVVLPPGGVMVRGREGLDRSFAQMAKTPPATDVLEYRFDWKEVKVLDDFAFEWGYIRGRERDKTTGVETSETYQVMRILQKQADGAWKVHRTIWNTPAAPAPN